LIVNLRVTAHTCRLATTSIMTSQKMSTAVAMVVPLVALGVPVIDTLMSMVRRFVEKRPLFSGAAEKQPRDADREAVVERDRAGYRDFGLGQVL